MDVRRWLVPGLAAAVVVAVIGGVALLGDGPGAPEGDGPTTPVVLGRPEPGTRWVSWRNVAVQVPEAWVLGHEPGTDWCANDQGAEPPNPGPYVAFDAAHAPVLSIGCLEHDPAVPEIFGPAPERLWQTHLTFDPAEGAPDTSETWEGWTTTTRTVGDVRLRLLTDDPEATDGLLATATTFTRDQHGCDITSPVDDAEFARPDPFDVDEVERVEAIAVCQYDRRTEAGTATLIGSHRITGDAAAALLGAIQRAPAGGGPDRPDSCTHDVFGDTAIALRLDDGEAVRDLYVYYDHCFGNGIDDGTTRRELTREDCLPLFAATVRMYLAHGSVFGRCVDR